MFTDYYFSLSSSFFSLLVSAGEKVDIPFADAETTIPALLEQIQADMFRRAKEGRDEKIATVTKWEDFVPALERQCMVMTPFCDISEWEEKVKVRQMNDDKI